MTHEDYVTLEQAKKLKQLGYDGEYHCYYVVNSCNGKYLSTPQIASIFKDDINAPDLYEVATWLRDKHHLAVLVKLNGVRTMWFSEIWTMIPNGPVYNDPGVLFESYEEALSHGISKALELL